MSKAENPYKVLGVGKDAVTDTIKKAYRKLARELHPDRGGDAERLKQVNAAWAILGDESKRKLFDEFGHEAFRPGFDPEQARAYRQFGGGGGPGAGIDLEDLLNMFGAGGGGGFGQRGFGGGGPFGRGPRRGQDLNAHVQVTLHEALHGGERSFQAHGKPRTVRIPRGVRSGQTLRVPRQGNPGMDGGPPGDLLLEIDLAPHPLVRVDRDDLEMDLPLTFVESIRGGKVEVPTPTGTVTVGIPKNKPAGTRMRLKGRGLPKGGSGTRQGDLYLVLRPTPPKGDEGLREALEALEHAYGGEDVRGGLRFD